MNFHRNFVSGDSKTLFIFGNPSEEVQITGGNGFSQAVTLDSSGYAEVFIADTHAMSTSGINTLTFHITSAGEVAGYFSNRADYSSDMTVLFDEESYGTEYFLASYGSSFGEGGQFSVTAIVDGTTVNVTLPDGQTFSETLSAGETLMYTTGSDEGAFGVSTPLSFDPTGTRVLSSEPVAVFSGHELAQVGGAYGDILLEQMPPVSALSTNYIVGEIQGVSGLGNNLIRVIAATDGTEITVNGDFVGTFNAGEYAEFILSDTAAVIETSGPALVAQYMQGSTVVREGDPSLMFVPGTDAWLSSYTLATPAGNAAFAENYVNIVIPETALASLTVNGAAVDADLFSPIPGTGYAVANIAISTGILTAAADASFQLSLFGIDRDDSYLSFGAASFASGVSNTPPFAAADVAATNPRDAVTLDVLANDSDADGNALGILRIEGETVSAGDVITLASGALVTLEADGTLTYDPNGAHDGLSPGQMVDEIFRYTVSDGEGGSSTASVTVTVEAPETPGSGLEVAVAFEGGMPPGVPGDATVTYSNEGAAFGGALIAVSVSGGLVADPLTGVYASTVYVLADGDGSGLLETGEGGEITLQVKGSAGPNSQVEISARIADASALSDFAERYEGSLSAHVDDRAAAAMIARVEALLDGTVEDLAEVLSAFSGMLETFGLNGDSALGALSLAIASATDFGSLESRLTEGAFGLGWSSLADLGLAISGDEIRLEGLADPNLLLALQAELSGIYQVSASADRSVVLDGSLTSYTPPGVTDFERQIDGSFTTVAGSVGDLSEIAGGYLLELSAGGEMRFDTEGRFLEYVSPTGETVTASHDSDGNIVGFSGPGGAALVFGRDPSGHVTSVSDADGDTLDLSYGTDETLDSATGATGTATFGYDADGYLATTTSRGGVETGFGYDDQERLASIVIAGGLMSESYSYDGGTEVTMTDGAGRSASWNLFTDTVSAQVTDGLGNSSRLLYAEDGTLEGVEAADGTQVLFGYDDQGRISTVTDAEGNVVTYGYDGDGTTPSSFTDAGGNSRSFAYDAEGRITTAVWSDGTELSFSYDAEGNLTGYTNRRGEGISYSYDAEGKLLGQTDSSDGAQALGYDAEGRLVSMTCDAGETRFVYDALDRLTGLNDENGLLVGYSYDGGGNLVQQSKLSLRTDRCGPLPLTGFVGGFRSDRHGIIERHPRLGIAGQDAHPRDRAADRAVSQHHQEVSAGGDR